MAKLSLNIWQRVVLCIAGAMIAVVQTAAIDRYGEAEGISWVFAYTVAAALVVLALSTKPKFHD